MNQIEPEAESLSSVSHDVKNAFSVDVEDYFHGEAFRYIPSSQWRQLGGRVERNVDTILSLLDDHGIRATFFFLGWVAKQYPGLTRKIHALGHEIASHGYWHRVGMSSFNDFYEDINLAKKAIEDIIGDRIYGHRLPSFDSSSSKDWYLSAVEKAGYVYDSSLYPTYHPWYGWNGETRKPHRISPGFYEIPMSCIMCGKYPIPLGGGGYFRVLPAHAYRAGIANLNRNGFPAVIYVHPHDIDSKSPLPESAAWTKKIRRLAYFGDVTSKIGELFRHFQFGKTSDLLPFEAKANI